jgi:hypothetical protein
MLADGIEAAVRALEGHLTRRKIQGVIQEIIKQRTDDGQLDESTVTQGDLHRIAEAFDTSLVGLLGRRIAYTESVPSLTPGAKRAPASDAGILPKANGGQRPKPRAGRPVGGRE